MEVEFEEKIQNVQRRLKKELGYDGYFIEKHPAIFERIDKIFLEEIEEKLI